MKALRAALGMLPGVRGERATGLVQHRAPVGQEGPRSRGLTGTSGDQGCLDRKSGKQSVLLCIHPDLDFSLWTVKSWGVLYGEATRVRSGADFSRKPKYRNLT